MKKSITKFCSLCCIILISITWNVIYFKYIYKDPDNVYHTEYPLHNLVFQIIKAIGEEFVFRYLPIILATLVYLRLSIINIRIAKVIIFPLIAIVILIQIIFSVLHLPLDPLYREIFYNLPPFPTFEEIFSSFLLQGVTGILLCISYTIYISKRKPLSLLQVKSLFASSFVHIVYNQLVILIN